MTATGMMSRGCGGGGGGVGVGGSCHYPRLAVHGWHVYYAKLLSQIAIKHIKLLNTYKSSHQMVSSDEKLTGRCTI